MSEPEAIEGRELLALAERCGHLSNSTPIAGQPDPLWSERQAALSDAATKLAEVATVILPRARSFPSDQVEAVARAALLGTEMARTGVVNPVNGSAPYSYVAFHGQRVCFYDGEFDTEHERDAGTAKAAAYASKINDALFDLAKRAALAALPAPGWREERAAVVAWLRDPQRTVTWPPLNRVDIADAIERGAHLPAPPAQDASNG